MIHVMVKTCTLCGVAQPLESFHRSKIHPQGRNSHCKTCRRAYHQARREVVRDAERARRALSPEKQRAYSQRFREARPEAQRVYSARHRAKRFGVENTLTYSEWMAVGENHGWRCAYCGGPHESIDHVVPLALGGPNNAENVVPACLSCNSAKGKREMAAATNGRN